MIPRALVLRAPGINCDRDSAHACRLVGFETDLIHINQLIKEPDRLLHYHFLVLPGGFSYGDDLGAGTLLAQNLTTHLGQQLQQFVDQGRPVLGICNGFQVLVRTGLLPGQIAEGDRGASLTENSSAQFECRWINVLPEKSNCIFTRGFKGEFDLPVANGEGRFVLSGTSEQQQQALERLRRQEQIALVYTQTGKQEPQYPADPNGSIGHIAGICNRRGTVLGLMPHPERYVTALQHPQRQGTDQGQGFGLQIFQNAFAYAQTLEIAEHQPDKKISGDGISYASSGVDIAASDHAKALMLAAVRSTQGPEVLAGMGAFAGMFNAARLQQMQQPALVASTDGVGTKTILASQAGRFETIGYDIVNHSINDLLTQGARPLFFMDYLAMGRLDPVRAATIVQGVAEACQAAGIALLGGETAEMPDVYQPGTFDLAGTIVGVIEQEHAINGAKIQPGDLVLGLPSSGLHTNGYSLARRVFAPYPLNTVFPELGVPLVDVLLKPHRSYLPEIEKLQSEGIELKGLAHITGGGFEGNISRILPQGTQAKIETSSWRVPPIFRLIAEFGRVKHQELYRALNMGIGMALVLSPEEARRAQKLLPELQRIGQITRGQGVTIQ